MKKYSIIPLFLSVLFTLSALCQVMPIEDGKLYSHLDGNQKKITNLQSVVIGTIEVTQGYLEGLLPINHGLLAVDLLNTLV